MAMKRRERSEGPEDGWLRAATETFVWDFPCCLEFLLRPVWEEGGARTTGTVMLMVDGGRWKVWAHDRDQGESCFLSGRSLEECFRALEMALSAGNGEWRRDRQSTSPGPKKRS
jgi:hypothetical protein